MLLVPGMLSLRSCDAQAAGPISNGSQTHSQASAIQPRTSQIAKQPPPFPKTRPSLQQAKKAPPTPSVPPPQKLQRTHSPAQSSHTGHSRRNTPPLAPYKEPPSPCTNPCLPSPFPPPVKSAPGMDSGQFYVAYAFHDSPALASHWSSAPQAPRPSPVVQPPHAASPSAFFFLRANKGTAPPCHGFHPRRLVRPVSSTGIPRTTMFAPARLFQVAFEHTRRTSI